MASRKPIQIRRHYGKMSEKQTDALVAALADLIVTYVKKRGGSFGAPPRPASQEVRT
jgi:hypothetical protein